MGFSPLTFGTVQSNGQLVAALQASALTAHGAIAPVLKGSQPQQPLTVGVPGGLTDSGSNGAAADAIANPLNFMKSPVPLLLIMLVVGMLGLRYIHFYS